MSILRFTMKSLSHAVVTMGPKWNEIELCPFLVIQPPKSVLANRANNFLVINLRKLIMRIRGPS